MVSQHPRHLKLARSSRSGRPRLALTGLRACAGALAAARSTGYVTAREHARSAPGQGLSEQDTAAWMGLHDDQAEGPILLRSRSQGYAPDGCLHEASVVVFGTPSGGFIHQRLGVRLVDEARERVRDSSDAREAVQRWAECMKDKGEARFPSPTDAEFKGSESEDGLKDVAVKDLECRAETDYTRRYHEALAAQLAPMLTEFAGEIEAYREMKAKAAERLTKG